MLAQFDSEGFPRTAGRTVGYNLTPAPTLCTDIRTVGSTQRYAIPCPETIQRSSNPFDSKGFPRAAGRTVGYNLVPTPTLCTDIRTVGSTQRYAIPCPETIQRSSNPFDSKGFPRAAGRTVGYNLVPTPPLCTHIRTVGSTQRYP